MFFYQNWLKTTQFICISGFLVICVSVVEHCDSFLLDGEESMNEFQVWLTVGDTSSLLDRQSPVSVTSQPHGYTVNVYRNDTRQIIDGFGASINNDGAYVIYHSPHRHEIMQELFGSGENDIGKIDYFKTECYHRQTYKHTVRQTEGPTDGRTDRQKTDIAQCKVAD